MQQHLIQKEGSLCVDDRFDLLFLCLQLPRKCVGNIMHAWNSFVGIEARQHSIAPFVQWPQSLLPTGPATETNQTNTTEFSWLSENRLPQVLPLFCVCSLEMIWTAKSTVPQTRHTYMPGKSWGAHSRPLMSSTMNGCSGSCSNHMFVMAVRTTICEQHFVCGRTSSNLQKESSKRWPQWRLQNVSGFVLSMLPRSSLYVTYILHNHWSNHIIYIQL